jgi:hypothetical protein
MRLADFREKMCLTGANAQGSLKKIEIFVKFDLVCQKQNEVYEFYEHFVQKKMFGRFSRNFAITDEKANICLFSKVGGPEIGANLRTFRKCVMLRICELRSQSLVCFVVLKLT